jgi:prophage regulatory protein
MAKQETQSPASALAILRRREVEARTGLGCSTIYDGIKAGTFPAPVKLGPQAVGWVESEINEWLAARVAARDTARKKSKPRGQ